MTTRLRKYNLPTAFVIFGGTGDLAQTKLFPALFTLYKEGVLPDKFIIVGLSRKQLTHQEFQSYAQQILSNKQPNTTELITSFCNHIRYVSGNFDELQSYEKIKQTLQLFDDELGQCTSKLFYLAVPPQYYSSIFQNLKESDAMSLCDNVGSWSRLLVEKPFGKDLETATALDKELSNFFSEDKIYRIDHYLEKDAIENILSLRFENEIFKDVWNKDHIESIAIRLFEKKSLANRGSFYDDIGALRDVGQNHILQILALLTMQNVDTQNATQVRTKRAEAIRALSHEKISKLIRAQYKGFKETTGVTPDSQTETYFTIQTQMESTHWQGVDIILSSGKALHESVTDVTVTFKSTGACTCEHESGEHHHKNVITITFSPEHHIDLLLWVKKPGFDFILEPRILELTRNSSLDSYSPEAYERVLYDCIVGDQTRFVSGEEVTAAWEFVTPILEKFKTSPLLTYEIGSTGPQENS